MTPDNLPANSIYTIGHSTHSLDYFLALLDSFGIEQLIDVRTLPHSFHNPQFNFESFPAILRRNGVGYRHEKSLGGLRKSKKDSINTAWQSLAFRGFADHMQTEEFHEAISHLSDQAERKTCVIMCAEAVPWRCHRSLIADALLVRGFMVYDIFGLNKCREHSLTPFAKVKDIKISYPG